METSLTHSRTYGPRPMLGVGLCVVRVVIALAAFTAFLTGPGARAQTLFRCAYTDVVMTSCCCPSTEQPADSHPVLSRACCCTIESVSSSLSVGVSVPKAPCEAAQTVAAMVAIPYEQGPGISALAPRTPNLPALRYRESSRTGPPLVIVHRRLLI